jgi:uncharacterized protein (DUF2141 family)
MKQFSKNRDTVTWYLKNLPVDSLELMIYNKADSLEKVYLSLKAGKKSVQSNVRKKTDDVAVQKDYVGYMSNIKGNALSLEQMPEITFFQPIVSWNVDSALLVVGSDSIYHPEIIFLDEYKMIVQFPMVLKEDTKYEISIPDSSFTDWNGLHNDAIKLNFRTKTLKDYGTFQLSVIPEKKQNYIIRLQTEKEAVVREYYFNSDTVFNMSYLSPGKYTLKLVFDDNGNRKWDTGKYIHKIQPEKIQFYSKPIEIRANWEIEEEWNF